MVTPPPSKTTSPVSPSKPWSWLSPSDPRLHTIASACPSVVVTIGEPRPSWFASQGGLGSPMVTTTDGHAEAIVWSLGSEGDNQLHGFDGDTGDVVFDGGGVTMNGLRRYNTPI